MNPVSVRSCLSRAEEKELHHIQAGKAQNEQHHDKLFSLGLIQNTEQGTKITDIGRSVITADEI